MLADSVASLTIAIMDPKSDTATLARRLKFVGELALAELEQAKAEELAA